MTTHDEVRTQLLQVLAVLTPYARSTGAFHDLTDVRTAITLAIHLLERAEEMARKHGGTP